MHFIRRIFNYSRFEKSIYFVSVCCIVTPNLIMYYDYLKKKTPGELKTDIK